MAKSQSIAPFPADINRDRFGDWLSGFTDGEGYFGLMISTKNGHTPEARFSIALRADDGPVLRLIQSYWQCGRLRLFRTYTPAGRGNPAYNYGIGSWQALAAVVIPHFDRYPLRAKKATDFAIWREGVLLGVRATAPAKTPAAIGEPA